MSAKAYHQLAKRLNPALTPLKSLVNDLLFEILELLFSEEEATIAAAIPLRDATAAHVARRVHRPVAEVRPILDGLAERGVIFTFGDGEKRKYLVMPLMPGIFEGFMYRSPDNERTRRFARLFSEYYNREYAENMLIGPSHVFRIIPVEESLTDVKSAVLPSDSIREVIDRQDAWALASACTCRRQKGMLGQACDRPLDVCITLGTAARYVDKVGFGRLVSKAEILEAVDRAEDAGLVHFCDNVETPSICCNCCACCCVSLATMSRFNTPAMFVNSRFIAAPAAEACTLCGICAEACPAGALRIEADRLEFDALRCIGCGVCASHCPAGAISMRLREGRVPVPEKYGELLVNIIDENVRVNMKKPFVSGDSMPGYSRSIGQLIERFMSRK